jgi:hypothetical protein
MTYWDRLWDEYVQGPRLVSLNKSTKKPTMDKLARLQELGQEYDLLNKDTTKNSS